MDTEKANTLAMEHTADSLPLSRIRLPSRVYKGLSKGRVQRSITPIAEPCSPTRSEKNIIESATAQEPGSKEPPRHHEPRALMSIPPELHMVILQCLEFEDIRKLRRTCKYWYDFATPRMIQNLWGREDFCDIMIRHCKICMRFCPLGPTYLTTTPRDPGYPLSSRCVPCTMRSRDGTITPGRNVLLGNSTEYCVCRWCGWPLTKPLASMIGHRQFHKKCYAVYSRGRAAFYIVRWLHVFCALFACALCCALFKSDKMVLVPAIIRLLWLCFKVFKIGFQRKRVRVRVTDLTIEVIVLGLWVSTSSAPPTRQSGH